MGGPGDEQTRESEIFAQRIDPIAVEVISATDPRDAYRAATGISDALVEDLHWLPHGGRMYKAWAELADLYETGKTPIPDAHAALQRAASEWLNRAESPTEAFIEKWVVEANDAARALVDRDGNFWRAPS